MSSATIKTSKLNYAAKLQGFNQFKNSFPRFAGVLAVNFFKDSFRRQGFIDELSLKKWDERKNKDKNKARRQLLVKSGRLRRSIRVIRSGLGYVVVGTDVPYAQIHNAGGIIKGKQNVGAFRRKAFVRTWKGKRQKVAASSVNAFSRNVNIKISQRQFIGPSRFLSRRILMNSENELRKILNIR